MGLKFVTSKLLEGVATWEQIQSLFSEYQAGDSRMSNEIVQVWLTEEWCRDPLSAHYFLAHPDTDTKSSQRTIEERESAEKPTRGNLKLLPQNPEGDGDGDEWAPARRRGGRRRPGRHAREPPAGRVVGGQPHVRDAAEGNENIDRQAPEEEIRELVHIVDAANVWQLNIEQRRTLHNYWLDEIRMQSRRELTELSEKYQQACKVVNEIENEIELSLLRNANVIGMTTTAAARHFDLLRSLKSNIVIVEEAAEVLEGHILSCLTSSVKHLILIGDHVQLRPSVAVYRLATEHKLDVSMFERLVRSGVQHVTLREQRRMRPEISKLVKSLYPKLKDHKSVSKYEAVVGLSSSVFFFDHKSEEEQSKDAASKFNVPEAKLVVELCLYLLNQGCYKLSDITILTMYSGQLQQIKTLLRDKISSRMRVRPIGKLIDDGSDAETDSLPRVSSVDDFQGEESDIVILSLVRSNTIVTDEGVGKIGFLRISNRICVALTRARKGFFIFGNAQLLSEKSDLWKEVTESLRKDGSLGPRLELYCQNHPNTKTQISKVEHFKEVEDGGCSKPCEYQLECGHVCPRRCHPGSHDLVVCPKPCKKLYDDCLHQCKLRCHGPDDSCPPCEVIVRKLLPQCGHEKDMLCCKDVRQEVCSSVCPRTLRCGHQCRNLCGRTCTHECHELVDRTLPCGHSAKIFCHLDPVSYSCKELCKGVLPECNHECQGSCGDCKQGTQHIPCKSKCGRNLPCSHVCNDGCSLTCPPCKKKCQKRCVHSRCSSRCGDLCTPCREPCAWNCAHIKCEKLCHEICTRPPCNLPCPKTIRACGHPCIGLCGEPCPTKCRVCHPHTKDSVTLMTLEESEESDRFIQLEDCGHLFEVSGLDTWMETSYETGEGSEGSGPVHVAIKLKECPECKTPIWRTHRYSNKVKEKQAQVEEVKKKINGTEFLRVGNLLLDKRDYKGALSTFMKALHQNPGLMEAHFGTGRAFSAEGNKHSYEKALMHFSFIVDKSSFASELAGMIAKVRARGKTVGITQNIFGVSSTRARDSLAGQAIVQWASTLTETREFSDAIKLCDTVLRVGTEEGTRTLALNIKQSAEKGEVQLVVQAMAVEVGTHGHWYTCPNGHLYTIGECGGAMQKSKCPACNAEIGGGNHRLAEGNRHSNIDGSTRSAWPGGA